MNIPKELKYTDRHLWLEFDENDVYVGLTDFAQEQMGDILYVDLSYEGDRFASDEVFCEVESAKATQEFTLPFDFVIKEANERLEDSPEAINENPYGTWLVMLRIDDMPDLDIFMDSDEYEEFCNEQQ